MNRFSKSYIQLTIQKRQMNNWPASKVRETFITYFQQKQHTFIPSSRTIPLDDPTLLFANSGMNQVRMHFIL